MNLILDKFCSTNLTPFEQQKLLRRADPYINLVNSSKAISFAKRIKQVHLPGVVSCYKHTNNVVRKRVGKMIKLIFVRTKLNFEPLIPCVFAMMLDPEQILRTWGIEFLQNESYIPPESLVAHCMNIMKFTYEFKQVISKEGELVRGYRPNVITDSEAPIHSYLYSYFRAFSKVTSDGLPYVYFFIRNIFDRLLAFDTTFNYKLYLCDNLAYFNYNTRGEVLCVMWHTILCLTENSKKVLNATRSFLNISRAYENCILREIEFYDQVPVNNLLDNLPLDCRKIFMGLHLLQILLLLRDLKTFLEDRYYIKNNKPVDQPFRKDPEDDLYIICDENYLFAPIKTVSLMETYPPGSVRSYILDREFKKNMIHEYFYARLQLNDYI